MKEINIYTLYSNFVNWVKTNNWIQEKQGVFYLTPEGEDEIEAMGIEVKSQKSRPKDDQPLAEKVKSHNLSKEEKLKIQTGIINGKKEYQKIHLYSDGGSRGNQNIEGGKAAIGVILCDEHDEEITTHKQYLGKATNNQAEYTALITGLNLAKNYHPQEVTCFSDSQLMMNQLNGTYRIKDKKLQQFVIKVKEIEKAFINVQYINVPRENQVIKKADKLVNKVLDAQGV